LEAYVSALRNARSAPLAAVLIPCCLASVAAAGVVAVAPAEVSSASQKRWHPQLSLGKGKRAARVYTCVAGSAGNLTAWFKLTTRSSTDRSYPRIAMKLAEGSHTGNYETSLMPGNRTDTYNSGVWTAAGTVSLKIYNQGKTKSKSLSIGALGAC
jgi:hypothetical protein